MAGSGLSTSGAQDPTHGGPIATPPSTSNPAIGTHLPNVVTSGAHDVGTGGYTPPATSNTPVTSTDLPNAVTSGAHDVGTGVTMPAAAPGSSANQNASAYNPGMQFTPAYSGDPAHPH
jgi:hypothetical protein